MAYYRVECNTINCRYYQDKNHCCKRNAPIEPDEVTGLCCINQCPDFSR